MFEGIEEVKLTKHKQKKKLYKKKISDMKVFTSIKEAHYDGTNELICNKDQRVKS